MKIYLNKDYLCYKFIANDQTIRTKIDIDNLLMSIKKSPFNILNNGKSIYFHFIDHYLISFHLYDYLKIYCNYKDDILIIKTINKNYKTKKYNFKIFKKNNLLEVRELYTNSIFKTNYPENKLEKI